MCYAVDQVCTGPANLISSRLQIFSNRWDSAAGLAEDSGLLNTRSLRHRAQSAEWVSLCRASERYKKTTQISSAEDGRGCAKHRIDGAYGSERLGKGNGESLLSNILVDGYRCPFSQANPLAQTQNPFLYVCIHVYNVIVLVLDKNSDYSSNNGKYNNMTSFYFMTYNIYRS
jgi:hypothetical protein